MNVGYCRLSRDDDRRNYASIENQRLVIGQYAAEHNVTIDRWYEDDGISGYIFDRPGFQKMMSDLEKDIDTVYVKDFSRLGRHNAKILLLLDEFQERGKRLIAIDDNYDSQGTDDDIIGIKTWYNERYVKDTSKKIRRVIGAKQKDGSLIIFLPFGYRRAKAKSGTFEIIPEQAATIRQIFAMYIDGYGYRRLAAYLTRQQVETPSMYRHEQELSDGKLSKRHVASEWTESMIKDILGNDFYIGTYRLHKRARISVHGKDRRVPEEQQYVFKNHHEPIIDPVTFELVQEIKQKRAKSGYKGSQTHGRWESQIPQDPFGSCLYCKYCGHKMTPIIRKKNNKTRKYYVCSLYNTRGKRYCSKSHLIEESQLTEDVINYIKACRNTLKDAIETIDIDEINQGRQDLQRERWELGEQIRKEKNQLKFLISQKIKDIAAKPENEDIIIESYQAVQEDLSLKIKLLEQKYEALNTDNTDWELTHARLISALDVIDDMIAHNALNRSDIELLIDKINIDEYGFPEIDMKYGLSELIQYRVAEELSKKQDDIIRSALSLVRDDDRGFTSVKSLLSGLIGMGKKVTKTNVLTIVSLLKDMGVIESSENKLKPYPIIMGEKELENLIRNFPMGMPPVWKESGIAHANILPRNHVNPKASIYAAQTDQNLHDVAYNRRDAGNGLRIYSEEKRH